MITWTNPNKSPADYRVAQKVIHWVMAALIIMDLAVAQKFGREMLEPDRFESRTDHSQVGTIILILLVIRLALRFRFGAPALPNGMTDIQRMGAHIAHWGLYILLGLLIATGILGAWSANSVVEPFGAFTFGAGVERTHIYNFARSAHVIVSNMLIMLIILHTFAAGLHLFKQDGSTMRMLRFWSSQNKSKS